ncbi:hypothetical protein GUITHDRAFT_109629 [Guillardia theta CCMP2712]|uniref:Uncharacterized protein n=2 Tax=Guillardia theta TaxID=55529 RepID=L1J8S6_GUITC|nr:hypothetical protein GUITHDRAFT_109629 [Guillardia theta CCMP2712]EKX44509.1 hypothetical protein GUITHDRAFT_109629 [Guillardia theta CCMP2712]|eukprot:XP_005831489.1 hypothetical protein GUITHDRAFT_109629 [Guillardia theta CCMP2712]
MVATARCLAMAVALMAVSMGNSERLDLEDKGGSRRFNFDLRGTKPTMLRSAEARSYPRLGLPWDRGMGEMVAVRTFTPGEQEVMKSGEWSGRSATLLAFSPSNRFCLPRKRWGMGGTRNPVCKQKICAGLRKCKPQENVGKFLSFVMRPWELFSLRQKSSDYDENGKKDLNDDNQIGSDDEEDVEEEEEDEEDEEDAEEDEGGDEGGDEDVEEEEEEEEEEETTGEETEEEDGNSNENTDDGGDDEEGQMDYENSEYITEDKFVDYNKELTSDELEELFMAQNDDEQLELIRSARRSIDHECFHLLTLHAGLIEQEWRWQTKTRQKKNSSVERIVNYQQEAAELAKRPMADMEKLHVEGIDMKNYEESRTYVTAEDIDMLVSKNKLDPQKAEVARLLEGSVLDVMQPAVNDLEAVHPGFAREGGSMYNVVQLLGDLSQTLRLLQYSIICDQTDWTHPEGLKIFGRMLKEAETRLEPIMDLLMFAAERFIKGGPPQTRDLLERHKDSLLTKLRVAYDSEEKYRPPPMDMSNLSNVPVDQVPLSAIWDDPNEKDLIYHLKEMRENQQNVTSDQHPLADPKAWREWVESAAFESYNGKALSLEEVERDLAEITDFNTPQSDADRRWLESAGVVDARGDLVTKVNRTFWPDPMYGKPKASRQKKGNKKSEDEDEDEDEDEEMEESYDGEEKEGEEEGSEDEVEVSEIDRIMRGSRSSLKVGLEDDEESQ